MWKSNLILILFSLFLCLGTTYAQEAEPFIAYDVPTQNLLKFNRFLVNPTFSTVREDKSYVNLFHRNQAVSFDDNNQTYFLSYSGRIGDRSGLGLSLYTQRQGLIDNFGVLANYAYGIRLSEKSNFTFGGNFSYYNSGFNRNRANPIDEDPLLNSLDNSALITFQPGFNLSFGAFDIGAFAENLFDYNLKTSESITDFSEKTYTGHLQYTHEFNNSSGILENGRLMPLARVSNVQGEDFVLGGSLILDLPRVGWLQAGYDDFYGAAAGIGFNLNKRISLGYTVEKGLNTNFADFGVNHEISLAYSFTPNLTEDRVMLEKDNETLADNDEETPLYELSLDEKDERIAELQKRLDENDAILDELLFRQDSIESNQQRDLERRFEMVMRLAQRDNPNLEPQFQKDAEDIYFGNGNIKDQIATQDPNQNEDTSFYNNTLDPVKQQLDNTPVDNDNLYQDYVSNQQDGIQSSSYAKTPRSFSIPNIDDGHYLIANVYGDDTNRDDYLNTLAEQGISADYFTNPKNGLDYVYLKQTPSWNEIAELHRSNFNGTMDSPTWVMTVKNNYEDNPYNNPNNNYNSDNVQFTNNDGIDGAYGNQTPTYGTLQIDGVGSGFYIIANVFAIPNNAERFVRSMNDKGFDVGYFVNPENNYRYVYLRKHEQWTNALVSYYSKLDNSYNEDMWIMRVRAT
ncbi:MAG: PorP/SprF family type IX secretion system membrane protein [Bacteroidota bacterium]